MEFKKYVKMSFKQRLVQLYLIVIFINVLCYLTVLYILLLREY